MKNILFMVSVAFLLTACAGSRPAPIQQSGMLKRAFGDEIIVYSSVDFSAAIGKAKVQQSLAKNTVAVGDYDLFTHGETFYRKWPHARNHKAIAYGYPERCGMKAVWFGVGRADQAIRKTFETCLKSVEKLGKALDIKCGCQLTAFNDTIFVDPKRMSYRSALPAIIMIVEKGKEAGQEIQGFIRYDGSIGKNLPLSFHNESGRKVCDGKHSVNMLTMSGDFSLSCFKGSMQGEGEFKVDGMREGRTYGTAHADTGNEDLYIVFGLSDEDLKKKRAELLSDG